MKKEEKQQLGKLPMGQRQRHGRADQKIGEFIEE
jgi:hypothetical protein